MTPIIQHVFPFVSQWRWRFFVLIFLLLVLGFIALFTFWWAAIIVGVVVLILLGEYYLLVDEIYVDADAFCFRKNNKVVRIERDRISTVKVWPPSTGLPGLSVRSVPKWLFLEGIPSSSLIHIKPRPSSRISLRHQFLTAFTTSDKEEDWPLKQDLLELFPEPEGPV